MGKKKSSTSTSSHNNNETPPKRRPASPSPPPPPPGTPPPALPSLMNSRMRIMSRDRGREKEARYFSNTINAVSKNASSVSRSPSPNPNGTSNHFNTTNTSSDNSSQLLREWSSGGTANQFPDFLQPIPRGTNNKPLFKDDTFISSMKAPTKKKRGSFIRRSMSLGNSSNNTVKSEGALDHRDMSSLFHVCFAVDDELTQMREFDKIDAAHKPLLWYTAKELRHCMAQEVEWNRRYEEGDVDEDDMAAYMAAPNLDDFVCWRGLEHVYEGEDRAARIRKVIVGIVGWYRDAKEMGYNDPDELRVVAKARTKADRTKAQKRGAQDAKVIKEMIKNNNNNNNNATTTTGGMSFQSTSSGSSPKKMARRISGKITSSLLPTLNWSPKPNKKEKAIAVS